MALEPAVLTTKGENHSPYKLDDHQVRSLPDGWKCQSPDGLQTIKASSALLKHIKYKIEQKDASSTTKNLLAIDDPASEPHSLDNPAIWLILTTKKFLTDQKRLKPRKISLPHPLNLGADTSICLITPDPQRLFKDAISHPSFPTSLSKRITKVIGIEKLEKKYHSFESKRQLRDSHDLFLADDRIITYLAKILGKTFYKSTQKRPIPVHLAAYKPKALKNAALPSTKPSKEAPNPKSITTPPLLAKEIERTLHTTQTHLSPSTTTAIKIGLASFTPEQIAANVKAVMEDLTGKLIAWRNIKSVYVKGPETTALPIWLATELWTDEGMILEDKEAEGAKQKQIQKGKKRGRERNAPDGEEADKLISGKKRKSTEGVEIGGESEKKKARKEKDEELSREMKERRKKLRQQIKEAKEKIEQGQRAKEVSL